MVPQRILRRVHDFTRTSTVSRRLLSSTSISSRLNGRNSVVLLISTISVAGLGYQAGKTQNKLIRASGNVGGDEQLLGPKRFKSSLELRSRPGIRGYKVPPYPLKDQTMQELFEAGERVIKDILHETHVNCVVSKNHTEDEWSYSQAKLDYLADPGRGISIWGVYDGHG